mgnify:CR=1 FL=1
MKLDQVQADKCILVGGDSGSGKTHLIGTFCEYIPTAVITSDPKGLDTLKSMKINPDVILLTNLIKAWDAYE